MNNTYFVYEDSSQNFYGGGQRISKIIIEEILKSNKKVILFDTNLKSKFINELKKLKNKNLKFQKIIHLNFSLNKKNSYTLLYLITKIINLLFFFIPNFLILNFHAIREVYFKNNVIFLSNTTFNIIYKFFIITKIKKSIFYAHQYIGNHLFIKTLIEKVLSFYDEIVCVSKFISKNYQNIPENKKIILNTPQKLSFVKNKDFKNEFNVFSISNLIEWKGIDKLLESYSLLKNKKKLNVKYHIFGTGSEIHKYKKKYKNKNIYIYGYKSDNFIKNFLIQKANLAIVPSIKEEACPHLPILSFSYAIPTIVTNIGGQSDLIKNNYDGFKIKANSSISISEKIDYLLQNKDKYLEMSKNAKKSSYNYSIDKYLKKISNSLLLSHK